MHRSPRTRGLLAGIPAALLLGAAAWADARGSGAAAFYLLLLGIPITAASGLAFLARLIDAANGARETTLDRLQALLAGILVAVFVAGAAVRSPLAVEAPGLAGAALLLGFCVLAAQALATLAAVRR
jgi:hypothetical protein